MSILTARSWDMGNTMLEAVDYSVGYNSTITASTDQSHTGAYSMRLYNYNNSAETSWIRTKTPSAPTGPSVSAWLYLDGLNGFNYNGQIYIKYLLDNGKYIDIRWNGGTHTFDAYIDGSLVASGTVAVTANNKWFHVQFYVNIAAGGSIDVQIDGHSSLSYSGDTTAGGGSNSAYVYFIGAMYAKTSVFIDDLVIGDGGLLGDLRCVEIRPNADTAQDDWTPSAGNNYSTIDETPGTSADYNETNADAQADELALEDLDSIYFPVAVVAWVKAAMTGAYGDSLKVGIDSGGTDDVTEYALSAAQKYYFHTADDNPDDSAEWGNSDIDNLLLRYESVIS